MDTCQQIGGVIMALIALAILPTFMMSQLAPSQCATISFRHCEFCGWSDGSEQGPPTQECGESMQRYLLYAIESGVARRSFIVALIVGTVLNIINQGDAILAGEAVHWGKAALTFAVPYCVATYGAVSYRIRSEMKSSDQ